MARLEAFLAEAEARPFDDIHWHCCAFIAAWVQQITGVDGMEPWRAERRPWPDLLAEGGGIVPVVTKGAVLAGLKQTETPERGDIGVFTRGGLIWAGICLGSRWATVGPKGLGAVRAEAVKAWSVACRS